MIVLTADRPPSSRHRRGQTIDQLKLYGDAVAGSARSGPTAPTTAGSSISAPSPAAPTPRRPGDPRPGPVHLNVPWREPLAPIPVEGDVTATDPLALEGRGRPP